MTAVIARVPPSHPGIVVPPLTACDADALLAMHDRCSVDSRFRRWHGHVNSFPQSYLTALLGPGDAQLAVVARLDGTVIGFASAARVDATTRELGLLVEDAWQHRGIGRLLLERLVQLCVDAGATTVTAEVLADDAGLVRPLRRFGAVRSTVSHGTITAVLDHPSLGVRSR